MKFDAVICGAAGQGIITISKIILRAAVTEGYEAQTVAFFGVAKTGGPVVAHLRMGNPAGKSPKIGTGKADIMLAMDRLEALKHRALLKPGMPVVVDATAPKPIYSCVSEKSYPSVEFVEEAFAGSRTVWINATRTAREIGNVKLAGAVMLGAMAAVTRALDRDSLVMSLRGELPESADAEAEAFFKGFGLITGKDE